MGDWLTKAELENVQAAYAEGRTLRAENARLREERTALRGALFGLLCCLEVSAPMLRPEERTLALTENCLPGFGLDEYDRAAAVYNATRKEGER